MHTKGCIPLFWHSAVKIVKGKEEDKNETVNEWMNEYRESRMTVLTQRS
jgi:hypothetical protein